MTSSNPQNNNVPNPCYNYYLTTTHRCPTAVTTVTNIQYYSHSIFISVQSNNTFDAHDKMSYFHDVAFLFQTPALAPFVVTPYHTPVNILTEINYETCSRLNEQFEKKVVKRYDSEDQPTSKMKKQRKLLIVIHVS